MRNAAMTPVRLLALAACAALLLFATAVPASAGHQTARSGHALGKKLPTKWLKAYKLKGPAARPLADPDRDGAQNWVEFRQRTNPRKPNRVLSTPPVTDVPASRIILLEGVVQATTPTGFTLQLESGLLVNVTLPPGAPVVDRQGLPLAVAVGQSAHVFVSQITDLSLTAVLAFVEDPAAEEPVSDDEDDGDRGDHGDHPGKGDPGMPCPPEDV